MTFLLEEEERDMAELQNALKTANNSGKTFDEVKQKYLQDLRLGQHETTIKINTHIHMCTYTCADR